MEKRNKNTRRITSSYWMGLDTFIVEFEKTFASDELCDKADFEMIMAEYHTNEDRWFLYKEYYDSDDSYIEQNEACFTPYKRAEYLSMAQAEYKRVTCGDVWDRVIGFDDYEKYDAFIDTIKEYYTKGDESKSNEIEDICVKHIAEMLYELNKKFK